MKRLIVDYKKLTPEILALLVEKYPDGYSDRDIIVFKNAKNETIEAVEVRNDDTIYLVKVSTRLATRMENYDEDDVFEDYLDDVVAPIKDLDMSEEDDDDDDDDDDDSVVGKEPDVFSKGGNDDEDEDDDIEDEEVEEEDDDI
ncbi:MAG: DNA primase [Flavobacteriaceae bacterium]|nr:DNA primase [Flavobacteriaceae bacterium]MDZ4147585.1 DNA primase [Flavobacteriaceae bacterium]